MAKKVMIVDDEEDIRNSLQMLLEGMGYDTVLASDGNDCLDKIRDAHPDLIIMDFFMPKISGRETTKKIREDSQLDDVKIIFLTVAEFRGEEYMDEFQKLKVDDYIQKPPDTGDFMNRVKQALGE